MTSTALLGIVTVVCLLNLVLLLGIVRRLNQFGELLSTAEPGDQRAAAAPEDTGLPAVGTKVRDFAVVDTDGQPLTAAALSGATLVGFFSIGCKFCQEFAPRFAALARAFPGGRERVLAVVVGLPDQQTDLVDVLGPVSRMTTEKFGGPSAAAFSVTAFPAFVLLQARLVVAAGMKPESLRLPSPQPVSQGAAAGS
jgi:thiol-disulfide isomerase/thioredoxin